MLVALSSLAALSPVQAFIGLGIPMYEPSCAYACRSVIASAMLECPDADDDHSGHSMMKRHGHASTVTPECRSTSAPFLSTLAYCIDQRCYHDSSVSPVPTKSRIEWYFTAESTGDPAVAPQWSFAEALNTVRLAPNVTYDAEKMALNQTMLVDRQAWYEERISAETFRNRETQHSKYRYAYILLPIWRGWLTCSVSIVAIGLGVPIALFVAQHLPYGTWTRRWLGPRYLFPSIFRGHVISPIKRVFLLPTLGQSFYIGLMTFLVLVFSFIDTSAILPSTWFADTTAQRTAYIANRTGSISMALMPLTILFAGRNNFLLYITGWSHGTYLLMHRWIARLCVLEVLIHSIAELRMYVVKGTLMTEQQELYWIWGSVGTVAGAILLVASIPRRFYYEIFLITHIILAVIFIVGTWYHIIYLYEFNWGYQNWIYACAAVWFVDRLLRLGRIGKNGLQSATVELVGEELVRVDIPGVRWNAEPGQHAYVFLPALRKWAPWENHPFSVIPTEILRPARSITDGQAVAFTEADTAAAVPFSRKASSSGSSHESDAITPADQNHRVEGPDADAEKSLPVANYSHRQSAATRDKSKGITIFIRRHTGITARLASLSPSDRLTSLLDGPYRSVHNSSILQVNRLIIIAGGIGITAVLPFVPHHRNVILYWGMREAQREVIQHLQPAFQHLDDRDKNVVIGKRLDIGRIIEDEVRDGWGLVGVLVCGPGGMCDDVRKEVVRLGSITATRFELQVEAFAW